MGSGRHRDRGCVARRGGDRARSASHGDDHRPGIRDRQQLRHRRGGVRRSAGARDTQRLPGALVGRRIGRAAYWLLTGEFVFTAETPLGMLMQHAQKPPTPPSARTDAPIPRALEELVLSCLAKDPADRAQSARETVAPAGRAGRRECVDPGTGARVVGDAPAGGYRDRRQLRWRA